MGRYTTGGRYHLVSGYLNATKAKIRTENMHVVTKPGFSVFKNEYTTKKMTIKRTLVSIAISEIRINVFIATFLVLIVGLARSGYLKSLSIICRSAKVKGFTLLK
jgi:hypothetical protein